MRFFNKSCFPKRVNKSSKPGRKPIVDYFWSTRRIIFSKVFFTSLIGIYRPLFLGTVLFVAKLTFSQVPYVEIVSLLVALLSLSFSKWLLYSSVAIFVTQDITFSVVFFRYFSYDWMVFCFFIWFFWAAFVRRFFRYSIQRSYLSRLLLVFASFLFPFVFGILYAISAAIFFPFFSVFNEWRQGLIFDFFHALSNLIIFGIFFLLKGKIRGRRFIF